MVMKKGVIAAVAVVAVAAFSLFFLFQDKTVEYTLVQLEDLSENMQRIVENLRFDRGYYVFGSDLSGLPAGEQLILVSSGEKPSGGHGIEVQKITGKGDGATAMVKETTPGTGENVTDALTYPIVLINAKTKAANINVVDDKNNPFPALQLERTFTDLTCVYVEQVGDDQVKLLISHEDWNRDGLIAATLSEELANSFGSLNVQDGDTVIVDLVRDMYGDHTVTKLVSIGGK